MIFIMLMRRGSTSVLHRPEHTFVFRNEKAKSVKTTKERVILLCCVSMSSEKREFVVIEKSKKPRCFRNIKKLLVQCYWNTNAWMTLTIFEEWLKVWNRQLTRKILLLIDNCLAHPQITLKNIKVVLRSGRYSDDEALLQTRNEEDSLRFNQ